MIGSWCDQCVARGDADQWRNFATRLAVLRASAKRVDAATSIEEAAVLNASYGTALHGQGRIHPRIARVFPFDRFTEAFEAVQDRSTIGRVLLRP